MTLKVPITQHCSSQSSVDRVNPRVGRSVQVRNHLAKKSGIGAVRSRHPEALPHTSLLNGISEVRRDCNFVSEPYVAIQVGMLAIS